MIRRPGQRFRISRALGIAAIALAIATVSCGPDLTTPASNNVSGTWVSPGPAAGFTNVTLDLTQSSDGIISGMYTATSDPALGLCASTTPCVISSTVSGANTVFQVFIDLNGAGQFTGQLIGGTRLKGAMNRINLTQPIEFTKS